MRISAAMRQAQGETWPALARRTAGLGFRGVSLAFDPQWRDEDLIAIRQAFDGHGVQIVELACPCNVLTRSADEARGNVAFLSRALDAGALLNCDHAVTFAGSRHPDPRQPLAPHPDNWLDATWDLLVQRVWALLESVEDLGVRLCFEPCPTTTLNTLDALSELMADLASVRVRVALDPAAIFSAAAAAQPAYAVAEVFSSLGDTIGIARATDVRLIEAGEEPHAEPAPLGEGVLDYEVYLRLVAALELDTPIIVKPQGSDAAYRSAHAFLANAAKRAGVQ